MGYACNLRCQFCYYIEDLEKGRTQNWSTDQLQRRLRTARRLGKTAVDFTGGEPSIRRDILPLIRYTKAIGYTGINMITNGLRLADPSFCESLLEAGLNDVLFSIHSPIEEEHDYLTRVRQHARPADRRERSHPGYIRQMDHQDNRLNARPAGRGNRSPIQSYRR